EGAVEPAMKVVASSLRGMAQHTLALLCIFEGNRCQLSHPAYQAYGIQSRIDSLLASGLKPMDSGTEEERFCGTLKWVANSSLSQPSPGAGPDARHRRADRLLRRG
ncbi:MAG: hypothetical protein ACJ8DJ_20945, partial [Gemmatimonadales bacterium]